jgi:phosphoglycerate dehydrogenase-like enzyme
VTGPGPTIALAYPLADPGVQDNLAAEVSLVLAASDAKPDLAAALRDADGLIVRGPAFISGELMDGARHLKVIASSGSGVDSVDVAAATERGIVVTSNAGVAPAAVSEYVLAAAVLARRQLLVESRRMWDGEYEQWDRRIRGTQARGLVGASFGVLGFGNIGRDVARRARAAFDAEIIAFDPYYDRRPDGVRWAGSLTDLCERSDVLSVHVPLVEQTRGMLGRDEMAAIGPRGVLINASRGAVVGLDELVACLCDGVLGGAVIDVYDTEPPSPDRLDALRRAPNLFCTPHIAGVSRDSMRRLAQASADSVLTALSGTLPGNAVNPTAWTT